ncbi:MAG: response regulator [Candidatus Hydrogenedentes bacterium]|nr:response regulator [Candidatus Hydrogenedentota bacterium]
MPSIQKTVSTVSRPALEALNQLREQVLTTILLVDAFLALPAIAWLSWKGTPDLYYYVAGFGLLLFITFIRFTGYTFRAALLLLLIYAFGFTEYWKDAYTSSGNIAFMAMSVLAALFFGLRAGLAAIVVSLASVIAIAGFVLNDTSHIQHIVRPVAASLDGWVDNAADLAVIGVPVLLVFAYLIRKLVNLIASLHEEIHERECASAALGESEQKYRLLAENVKDVVYLLDLDLQVEYCSHSILDLAGYTAEELLALPLQTLFTQETFRAIQETYTQEMALEARGEGAGEGQRLIEFELICKSGVPKWIESGVVLLRDASGKPRKILGVSRDITDRKNAEAEHALIQIQMQEMQKLESLGLLAGGIAHDFNNLLMGIVGNADLALERTRGDEEQQACLEEIVASSQRASELCGQLLAYSGRGKFLVQAVDLSVLLQEMVSLLSLSVGKGVSLIYDFEAHLPPVEADVTRLRQAIMNLIINASDAIGPATGTIRLVTRMALLDDPLRCRINGGDTMPGGAYVCLQVHDTGCGMEEESRSRIFDPFYTTKQTGHGLGLAALLGFVRSHGGGIQVESQKGTGTVMSLWLPPSDKPVDSLQSVPQAADASAITGLILLVDDEEPILRLASKALSRRGFEVLTASSGSEAISIYATEHSRIHAVLLDMTMPEMTGLETFHLLREINPNIRAILSSGHAASGSPASATGKGLVGFLQKPYRIEDLVNMVRQAVESTV